MGYHEKNIKMLIACPPCMFVQNKVFPVFSRECIITLEMFQTCVQRLCHLMEILAPFHPILFCFTSIAYINLHRKYVWICLDYCIVLETMHNFRVKNTISALAHRLASHNSDKCQFLKSCNSCFPHLFVSSFSAVLIWQRMFVSQKDRKVIK